MTKATPPRLSGIAYSMLLLAYHKISAPSREDNCRQAAARARLKSLGFMKYGRITDAGIVALAGGHLEWDEYLREQHSELFTAAA